MTNSAQTGTLEVTERLRTRGQLTGAVCHDLNNVLAVILIYMENLLDLDASSTSWEEDVKLVRKSIQRGVALVRQLTTYSEKASSRTEVIQINEIIQYSIPIYRKLLGDKILFTPQFQSDLPETRFDPIQLEQTLLQGLVQMAKAFLPEGVIKEIIFKTTECATLLPSGSAQLLLEVSIQYEKGKGRLDLTPFSEGAKIRNVPYRTVEESENIAKFELSFPLVIAEDNNHSLQESPKQVKTILFVEDNEGLRKIVRLQLEKRGYRILAVNSAEQALQLMAAGEKIHLLLTDIALPNMNGVQLAKELNITHPQLKTLFISGYFEIRGNDNYLLPNQMLLEKPFDIALLVEKVEHLMERPV